MPAAPAKEGCSAVMLGTCGVAGSVHASWLGTGGVISSMPSAAGTGDVRSIGGVAMGVVSPGWREETSTKRTPNAQTTDRSINKVHLPTVFVCLFFFPFEAAAFFLFGFGPGEKMNCFYTGQFPDVPMAPLFFRWFQVPPGCKVQTTGEKPRKKSPKGVFVSHSKPQTRTDSI